MKWLVLFCALAVSAHAEDACRSISSPLAIYTTCDLAGSRSDCDEMSDTDGRKFFVNRASKTGLSVERAVVVYDMFKSSVDITYDKLSRECLFKFTAANVHKIAAFVAGNQVLLAPTIMEAIDNPKSRLTMGVNSTYDKVVQVCESIRPDCVHENVTLVLYREKFQRFVKKIRDQLTGKSHSVMDEPK